MAGNPPITQEMLDEIHFAIEYFWSIRGYCKHTLYYTSGWLRAHLRNEEELEAAVAYLGRLGCHCDCEVYTKLRHEDLQPEDML
jgi:hypothetical protein